MRALSKEEDSFDIPLTPLIDVVFLLLIFFLVATNFSHKEYDQRVELPKASGGKESTFISGNLVLNVHKDGAIIINGRVIEDAELTAKLSAWKTDNAGNRVIIRSDGGVQYSRVMGIMSFCKEAGIERVDLPVIEKK